QEQYHPGPRLLLVNLRTYDIAVRQRIIDSLERMVSAECEASGSPHPPESEYYDQYPLTDNDPDVTERITSALRSHFGAETIFNLGRQTASEDFSTIPDAFGTPYTYWGSAVRTRSNTRERSRPAGWNRTSRSITQNSLRR
ncbi:MAG: hypothetical protein ACRERE_33230, partial [Candidatus Entotheonellia bacterium]